VKGKLKDVHMQPPVVIAAAERHDGTAFVPGPETQLEVGRRIMAIADLSDEAYLRTLLDAGDDT
jgi:Trk K+ transport system NAD-binding subunit